MVGGKKCIANYIIRIDIVKADGDRNMYEGVFLKKVSGDLNSGTSVFVANDHDIYAVINNDIVTKLPKPVALGVGLVT